MDRTEEAAEAGYLDVTMGGRSYRLPVLTIEQSETWQGNLAHVMSGLDVDMPTGEDEDIDGEKALRAILTQGNTAMFAALSSYDVDDVLGGEENMRRKMTRREVKDAIESIMDAEFPFEQGGGRSVVEAFGLPLRVLGAATRMATAAAATGRSVNGPSPIGASPTPTSAVNGRPSNSQSDGPTASAVSPARPTTGD